LRKILDIIAEYQFDLSDQIDLNKINIIRLWTITNEEQMWQLYPKFNTQTGEKIEYEELTLDDLNLQHFEGIFLEDKIHDWNVVGGKLNYYSRIVEQHAKVRILIEYENI